MCGEFGVGMNCLNVYIVCKVIKGLVSFIEKLGEEVKKCGVVVVYDFCYKLFEFVMEVVVIFGVCGIIIYVFESLCLMLVFFFVVCYLYIVSGIVFMVSYNLFEYNGYKVYGEDGG